MKISCQSCQAKYTIADDKVLGKIVKIRCKKCGETIVVNGAGATGDAIAASAYPEPPAAQGAAGDEPWTVNVADGDQRTMTEAEVVTAYQSGVISDETYCWRDGMGDWLPLREIDALQDACNATRAMSAPSELQRPPGVGPQLASSAGNGSANRQEPLAAAPVAPTATARRAGGRAPTGDLFGAVAQAGSEEDVMTSAPAGMPQARMGEAEKMVGERNENSVLFSLSALTSKGPGGPPKPAAPGGEASGLIDIKQLSAQLHSANDKKKRSGIDDIMNLAGGGAFSPSLTAPTLLTAPSISEYSADASGAGGPAASKNRGLIFLALGGGAIFVVAAIGAAVMLMRPKGTEAADKAAGSASAAEMALASAAASGAPGTAAPGGATGATAAASASASSTTAATETAAPKAAETKTAAATTKTPAVATTAAATTAPKESLAAAMAGTPPAAAPAAQAAEPFNMGEAKARLASAASAAQGCKKGDGPTGSGRVVVMFAPSGAAQSATVTGPPFEGTPTGACVSARFRGVRVPAFSGSPFSVSKSFSIN